MTEVDESKSVDASNRIITIPNIISFIRLCMVPIYMICLLNGQDIAACVLFSVAAATDFLDGQIARRTNSVSNLGKLLDPAVDTVLMICGVLGLVLVGRLPIWIAVIILAREAYLLIGGAVLLKTYNISIAVIYPGKFATAFLFFGMAGLLLNMPLVPGLNICDISWLPGFTMQPVCWSIWLVYIGLILQIGVTIYYSVKAWNALQLALAAKKAGA